MTPNFTSTLESTFAGIASSLYPSVPVFYENSEVGDDVGYFLCFHIMPSDETYQINLGLTSKSRNPGVVQIDVFAPRDVGAGPAQDMVYALSKAMKRQKYSVVSDNGLITMKDPSVQSRGIVRGRFKMQASIPYRYDWQDM